MPNGKAGHLPNPVVGLWLATGESQPPDTVPEKNGENALCYILLAHPSCICRNQLPANTQV
jgi:hypothetical protein